MKIVAKSDSSKLELEARKDLGFRNLELQLLKKDYDIMKNNPEVIMNNILGLKLNLESIHTPLGNDFYPEVRIEYTGNEHLRDLLFASCNLANLFSYEYNKSILVVVHNGLNRIDYELMPILYKEVVKTVDNILNRYYGVELSIENICPFDINTNETNGSRYGSFELTKMLRQDLKTNRIGVTVDTCHYMMTEKIYELLNDAGVFGDSSSNEYNDPHIDSLEDYIRNQKGLINNIHLNNIRYFGNGSSNHSAPFLMNNKSDLNRLKEILKVVPENSRLTLEVNEDDYIKCNNLCETAISVRRVASDLGINIED